MEPALAELRTAVMDAHRARTPLRLCGAGTKDFYGESCQGARLDVRAYRGVVEYEPSELVITARCGTPLSEIEALLGAVLLGVEGEPLHFGGRVMKNVAGFDVARLLCGSLGILGPITEVSLKVMPLPREEQTLRFELTEEAALAAFNRWAGQPLPISATAWWNGSAWLRLSGAPAALRAARQHLGGEPVEPGAALEWWQALRSQEHRLFGAAPSLWRLSLPSSTPPLPLAGPRLLEWGGALRWYASELPEEEVRRIASGARGTALHWRGGAPGKRFHPLPPAVLDIHRRLKARFDPHGIFNQNRLVAGL
jgi:glycolate dehydrogenase FAD-binding subunit